MDLKTTVKFEKELDGKKAMFICDADSPLGFIHDFAADVKSYVIGKMKEAEKDVKEAVPEPEKQE